VVVETIARLVLCKKGAGLLSKSSRQLIVDGVSSLFFFFLPFFVSSFSFFVTVCLFFNLAFSFLLFLYLFSFSFFPLFFHFGFFSKSFFIFEKLEFRIRFIMLK
jgi:hypothetical protein